MAAACARCRTICFGRGSTPRFNTGEERVYDCKPLLSRSGFAALKDTEVCNSVYIDYGVTVWCDGEIDISPNELYTNGAKADKDIA